MGGVDELVGVHLHQVRDFLLQGDDLLFQRVYQILQVLDLLQVSAVLLRLIVRSKGLPGFDFVGQKLDLLVVDVLHLLLQKGYALLLVAVLLLQLEQLSLQVSGA